MGEGWQKVSIRVTGMSCAACARRVEETLLGVSGVASASVNMATEKATVEYDAATADTRALIHAVEGAGYDAVVRETAFGVAGMTCAACAGRVEKALRGVPGALRPFLGEHGFLNPVLAAAAMALSSLTVVLNALRLRRAKIGEEKA